MGLPWKTLGIMLLIAFGVPVLVLLLGAALAGALSGFTAAARLARGYKSPAFAAVGFASVGIPPVCWGNG